MEHMLAPNVESPVSKQECLEELDNRTNDRCDEDTKAHCRETGDRRISRIPEKL